MAGGSGDGKDAGAGAGAGAGGMGVPVAQMVVNPLASAAAPAMAPSTSIREWLASANPVLTSYSDGFEAYGFDNLGVLLEVEEGDVVEAMEEMKVKKIHRKLILKKFRAAVGSGTGTSSASASSSGDGFGADSVRAESEEKGLVLGAAEVADI